MTTKGQLKRVAQLRRAFARLIDETPKPRGGVGQLGWIMHPRLYHLLRYGATHESCVWWDKFLGRR